MLVSLMLVFLSPLSSPSLSSLISSLSFSLSIVAPLASHTDVYCRFKFFQVPAKKRLTDDIPSSSSSFSDLPSSSTTPNQSSNQQTHDRQPSSSSGGSLRSINRSGPEIHPVQLRVCIVLKKWLDAHFYDFVEDMALTNRYVFIASVFLFCSLFCRSFFSHLAPSVLYPSFSPYLSFLLPPLIAYTHSLMSFGYRLLSFIDHDLASNNHTDMKSSAELLKIAIKKKVFPESSQSDLENSHENSPPPILPSLFDMHSARGFDIIDISSLEIARQMCLLEFQLFQVITPKVRMYVCVVFM